MNIFFHELHANKKSLLIWCGIVILFNLVGFSKYSAFYKNPELLSVLDGMPPALLSALDMNAFNLTTVTGFFGVMVIYFNLILSIAAAMWGSDIISKEERDKTVEFALTLPVKREKLITAKIAAVIVNCIVLLLITWGSTLLFARQYNPDSAFNKFVALNMLAFLLAQMVFMAVGILLGCAMKSHKLAGSTAVSVLLACYFISILTNISEKLNFLKYFTPFSYFEAATLLRDSTLDPKYIGLSLLMIALFLAGGYFSYSKRDLYI